MTRASTRTILSLDKYAEIMGINPVFFSGSSDIELTDGRLLFPLSNAQNDIWPQYEWQNFDQVSREALARQIRIAEEEIIQYLGYSPVPIWIQEERHDFSLHYRPELQYRPVSYDAALNERQVKTDLAHFISGGKRAVTLIDTCTVTYWDLDADGWDEFAAFNVVIPAGTDPAEVKIYFQGRGADETFEIRKPKSKVTVGNVITFGFNTWQMVDPEVYETLPTSDTNSQHIDFSDPTVFVTDVEAYREYNDTTQNHALFTFNNVTTGAQTTQGGFIYRIQSDDFVIPIEGDYNATTGEWDRVYTQCGYPDYVDLWYYTGMRKKDGKKILDSDSYLPEDFAMAIAYMATARLERGYYANNNATALAAHLREDHLQAEQGQFKVPPNDARVNPFGSKVGEVRAWRLIYRYKSARRSGGSL